MTTPATKTDNHNPAAKLELRRHFLRRYHAGGADVLDCCQGSGLLWSQLRREFSVRSYWGLDVKPKRGRLKMDSVRVLAQPGWPQDVIDVDTYGTPWKHWLALLPNVTRPLSVFLTCGRVFTGGALPLSGAEAEAIGAVFPSLRLPGAFTPVLCEIAVEHFLALPARHGLAVVEAVEAVSDGNARYLGVRLSPADATTSHTPASA